MKIEFRDAICKWVVPEPTPGIPLYDELHVKPKTDEMRNELRKAMAEKTQVVNSVDKALYPRRYDVVREVAGVFILTTKEAK